MADWKQRKTFTGINGLTMALVEQGEGDPIVLLHGNPTSSYLWRDVMPPLEGLGRLIAPDLVGMGDSDKLPESGPDHYTFVEHREYLDALLETLGVTKNVTLVVHDWGSALGFDWALRHPEAVKGIAYMEAIVMPLTWDEWPDAARGVFQGFRSEAGEDMVLEQNVFVEQVLPGSILRDLSDDEMAEYRRPFSEAGEDRRPTLTWPRHPPTWSKSSPTTASGSPLATSPSSSSTPSRGPSWSVRRASSAAAGITRKKSPSRARTSCRKTRAKK